MYEQFSKKAYSLSNLSNLSNGLEQPCILQMSSVHKSAWIHSFIRRRTSLRLVSVVPHCRDTASVRYLGVFLWQVVDSRKTTLFFRYEGSAQHQLARIRGVTWGPNQRHAVCICHQLPLPFGTQVHGCVHTNLKLSLPTDKRSSHDSHATVFCVPSPEL